MMGIAQDGFSIPVELGSESIRLGIHKELKFVAVLKHLSPDGKFERTCEGMDRACDLMGLRSRRSFYNYADRIIDLGWANECDGVLYVRSWRRMARRIGASSTKAKAKMRVSRDLDSFEEFLFSARVCFGIRKRKERVARQKGRVIQALDEVPAWSLDGWSPCPRKRGYAQRSAVQGFTLSEGETFSPENMSLTFIGEIFGINKVRSHRLKHRSIRAGYLGREVRWHKTPTPDVLEERFKMDHPEVAHRVSCRHGYVAIRLTDELVDYGPTIVTY